MNPTNNMRFFLLGAFLAVVAADAPLGAYAPGIPSPVYGVPNVQLPLTAYHQPAPAPVYSVPALKPVASSYRYEVINHPRPVEILTSYPQPILRAEHYPVPSLPSPIYGLPRTEILKPILPVASGYSYQIAQQPIKLLKTYAAPAPVYTAPAPIYSAPAPVYSAPAPIYSAPAPVYSAPAPVYTAPAPVYSAPRYEPLIPSPVYGAPRIELPSRPLLTSYDYNLPAVRRVEVPLPSLVPHAPAVYQQYPVAPHSRYGLPLH